MTARRTDRSVPLDAETHRSRAELRRRLEDVSDRIAELQQERSSLLEVKEQLRVEESSLSGRLHAAREERQRLQDAVEQERRRALSVDEESVAVREDVALLGSEAAHLERRAAQLHRQIEAVAARLAAYREQRTATHAAISGARGGLTRLQHRLSDEAYASWSAVGQEEED
jgi:chromosome segregation ATPase